MVKFGWAYLSGEQIGLERKIGSDQGSYQNTREKKGSRS